MAVEKFVEDPIVDFPTVNVALCVFETEIQLHQGSNLAEPVPTLSYESIQQKRDVVSMSLQQAREVAKQILELVGDK
jgi:hypothetical protein